MNLSGFFQGSDGVEDRGKEDDGSEGWDGDATRKLQLPSTAAEGTDDEMRRRQTFVDNIEGSARQAKPRRRRVSHV